MLHVRGQDIVGHRDLPISSRTLKPSLPCDEPLRNSEQNDATEYRSSVVHGHPRQRQTCWQRHERHQQTRIAHSIHVHNETPPTEIPRSENESLLIHFCVAGCRGGCSVHGGLNAKAQKDKTADGDDVRHIERDCAERQNRGQRSRRADIDQGEEHDDKRH